MNSKLYMFSVEMIQSSTEIQQSCFRHESMGFSVRILAMTPADLAEVLCDCLISSVRVRG
jgi:hypothetical protein